MLFSVASRKVEAFLRTSDGPGRGSRLDFPVFVKGYAWVFYRQGEDSNSSDTRSGSSSRIDGPGTLFSSSSDQENENSGQKSRPKAHRKDKHKSKTGKLGYGTRGRREDDRGRKRGGGAVGVGIGEEAELRRWRKRLGEKQMRRLQQVFDAWAEDARGDEGGVVQARDLEGCFRELGRDVEVRKLRAWCDEVDLAPGDALSLADFAYAFHSLFLATTGEGGFW